MRPYTGTESSQGDGTELLHGENKGRGLGALNESVGVKCQRVVPGSTTKVGGGS